ncbi:HAD domain-containing protein [uncultured Bradyrhizobium sp.]|jgi:hypothetical protein|uniref:HAD domain-containing protein n=1 Tax=uncultured Bradyrhizobium sp. TaxID=199684 RepID=UPI00263455BA|nr:HAD domain-containing protein [uncultured Bradyrhizobium sp.]
MTMSLSLPPIIFLDIDGVLNVNKVVWRTLPVGLPKPGRAYKRPPRRLEREREFSCHAVTQLERLVRQTGALLVLSSSWRLRQGARETLAGHGVIGPWHDDWRTDALAGGRGAQISRWLARNGSPRHVILDDWPHELREHGATLVRIDDRIGLTRELASRAGEIIYQQRFQCSPAVSIADQVAAHAAGGGDRGRR